MRKLLIIILVACFFTGCIKQGNQNLFDEIYRNRVQIGDTIEKAIEIFGKYRVMSAKKSSKTKSYSWIYGKGYKGGSITITVDENGKIVDIINSKVGRIL